MGEILDKILQILENKKPSPQKYFPPVTNASDAIRDVLNRQATAESPVSPEAAGAFADNLNGAWNPFKR